MKQKPLSLFGKLLLGGALFAVIGCTDYADDIRDVNERIDAVISGQIEPLKADLEKAVTTLTEAQEKMEKDILAKHKEDIDALKGVDAGLRKDIDAANASILNLQKALETQKSELQKAINDLEKKHDADVKTLQDKIAELKADYEKNIDALRADMNEKVAKLEESIAAANAEIEKLKTKDEQLQAQLNLAFSQIRELSAKVEQNYRELKADIDTLQAQVDKNAEAIAANAGNIDVLNAAVAEIKAGMQAMNDRIGVIETDLFNHINTFNAFRTAINEKIAALEVLVRDLQAAIAEIENIIPAMQEQIEANKELSQNTASELYKHQALFEQYKISVSNTFQLLKEADKALQTAIDNLSNDLAGLDAKVAENYADFVEYKASIRAELDEHFAALEAYKQEVNSALASLTSLSQEQALKIEILMAQNEAKTQLINQLNEQLKKEAAERAASDLSIRSELQAQIEKHNADVLMLQESINSLKAEVDKLHDELIRFEADIQYALSLAVNSILEQLKEMDVRVSDIEFDLYDKEGLVQTAIADLEAAYKAAYKAMKEELDRRDKELQDQINILKNRVQSLVYVPDYNDGKATVNVLDLGDAEKHIFIEGRSTLTYKVNPAELAPVLAKGEGIFAFDVIGVMTRAADEPQMNIISTTANADKGTITFVVETRNFADEFYAGPVSGTQSYSAALVLAKEESGDNVSSEYTNLIPAVTLTKMKIVDRNGEDITNMSCEESKLEFPYTKREGLVALDGHKLMFVIGDKEIEQSMMAENGYDVEVEAGLVTEYDPEEAEKSFVIDEEVNAPYATVSLAETVGKENVGESVELTYTYTYNGATVFTSVPCEIIKERAEITLTKKVELNWNYALDAAVDADKIAETPVGHVYSRKGLKIAKDEFSYVNVPADADLAAIITGTVNATPSAIATLSCDAESGDILVDFSAFEWNKTYTLTRTYQTESIELVVKVEIQTIDRNRDELIIAIDSTTVTYAKNFELAKGEKTYSIAPLFDALTSGKNLGISEITAVEYFNDILSEEHYDAKYNVNTVDATGTPLVTILDLDETVLGFDINEKAENDNDKHVITPGFTYKTFSDETIKPEVLYTKTFTTWYGQKITITHKLKFEYPSYDFRHSEITVAEDTVNAYFYTQVLPLYTPDGQSTKVSEFKMDNVTMEKEFNIVYGVGDDNILDDAAIKEAGLVAEYELLGKPGAGITMVDNVLSYNDRDEFVNVRGNLFIVSDNGARMQLPTSFDEGQKYATYRVKKYDPIGEVNVLLTDDKAGNIEITNAIDREFNILDYITLKDNRPFGYTSYDLITPSTDDVTAHWTIGNDEGNGFAPNANVTDIYGLKITYAMDVNSIPVLYRKFITFDENTGVLTFWGSGMSRLQTVLPVNISFNVEYTWGTREVVIPFRFYSPEL